MEGKALETRLVEFEKLGSLSNDDDDDGNENCKKGIGLDDAPASPFFVHLFAFTPRHDVKMPIFTRLFFFSWTTIQCLRIELQKNLPTFDVLQEIKEARKSSMQRVFTHFKWRFCSRRCQSPSWLLTQLLRTKLSTMLLRNTCLFANFWLKTV